MPIIVIHTENIDFAFDDETAAEIERIKEWYKKKIAELDAAQQSARADGCTCSDSEYAGSYEKDGVQFCFVCHRRHTASR